MKNLNTILSCKGLIETLRDIQNGRNIHKIAQSIHALNLTAELLEDNLNVGDDTIRAVISKAKSIVREAYPMKDRPHKENYKGNNSKERKPM